MEQHLIVDQYGAFVGKKSERLRVTVNKKVIVEVPFFKLEQVLIVGRGVSLSSDCIRSCVEAGVPIHLISRSGKPYAGLISAGLTGTIQTRRQQLTAYEDKRGVALGQAFARGKLLNQINLLRYMAKYRRRRDRALYEAIQETVQRIRALVDELAGVEGENIDAVRLTLLNLEGRGAHLYWEAIRKLLPPDLEWPGREHRGAGDLVNSCLNYGYGILYTQVQNALLLAGLDPYAGFLHVDRPGKPSLVLDLIEEFRQMVVDRVVFGMMNKRVGWAVDEKGYLTDATRKALAEKVLERLEGREPYEGQKHKLRTILHRQAQRLATFVRGERKMYEPFVGRW